MSRSAPNYSLFAWLTIAHRPGSGSQLAYINPKRIKTYHAAEPAKGLHDTLNRHAKRAGLSPGKNFRILPCGGEVETLIPGLQTAGLLPSDKPPQPIFDSIVTIRVLCSVPSAEATLKNLYALLRPGGRLIVVEHVVNPWRGPWGSSVGRLLQRVYTLLGWSFFVGDCHLERDTEGLLKRVGVVEGGADWSGWTDTVGGGGVKLSAWWGALPYVSGVLVKR